MTAQATRKIRVKIALRLFLDGKLVYCTTRTVKARIIHSLQEFSWSEGYICVTYPLGKGYFNDGCYRSCSELRRALDHFTELDLIKSCS